MYLVTLQKVKPQETTGLQITGEFVAVFGKLLRNNTDDLVVLEVIIWLLTTVYGKYESLTHGQLRRSLERCRF